MDAVKQFSDKVSEELKCYVYRLIDPRNGTTFYVGRGRGNRVFAHVATSLDPSDSNEDTDLKLGTIRAIRNAGFEVQHVIHRHGMDEKTAAEVEAALIDAYPGLTNLAKGSGSDRGIMHANEIVRKFEASPAVFSDPVVLINVNRYTEEQDLYNAVRYAWKISERKAKEAKYILAVRKGLIIGAFEAHEWMPRRRRTFQGFPRLIRNAGAFEAGRQRNGCGDNTLASAPRSKNKAQSAQSDINYPRLNDGRST
jgi:uncharacterized protein